MEIQKQPPTEAVAALASKRKRVASVDSEIQKPSSTRPPTKKACLPADLSISAPEDSRILEAVESKYHVQIHSVISSSKIQTKVTSVLRHLTSTNSSSSDKPPVSVLRAKASDAGKLVSIAEIAKREIAAQQDEGKGRWFQYIGLGQQIKETPKEKPIIEETILGGGNRSNAGEEEHESDGEGDDFEYMKTPFERALEGKPKKQAVAIMSLFLARVSVDELKRRYGEQTNTEITKSKT